MGTRSTSLAGQRDGAEEIGGHASDAIKLSSAIKFGDELASRIAKISKMLVRKEYRHGLS
jgi:hypothetical protein